ncbi:MAG: hypothetical protein L0154_28690 [Chloroflexi bacterium]|nr:hypothetical protein [Chloroflexota bacterium]
MPPLFFIITPILVLAAPLYGITIILFDTERKPRQRTVLALGGVVLIKAIIITLLAGLGILLGNRFSSLLPLLVVWAGGFAVILVMRQPLLTGVDPRR